MLHPSTKRLIDKLSEMTRKKKVAWQESENDTITHDTEGYRVTLTPDPHAVLLTDALGREIESCRPEEFADEIDADGRPYAMFVAELYREARRHARGAEKAINALLAGLDEAAATPEAEETSPELEASTIETEMVSPDALIEDPGDDSNPLDSETYPELEGQSDIANAVASMADQVNGQTGVELVDEAPEPETDDAITPDAEMETLSDDDEPVAEAVTTEVPGTEDAIDVLQTQNGIEAVALVDEPVPYEPAFLDVAADAEIYAVSEPVGTFEPAEPPATEPEIEFGVAPQAEPTTDDVPPAEETAPAETEPEMVSSPEPEPAPQEQEQTKVFAAPNFFGAGFSTGLDRYRTSDAPAQHEAPTPHPEETPVEAIAEPDETPVNTEPFAQTPVEETSFAAFTPEAEPEPEPAPEPVATPTAPQAPSFSLSGITSGFGLGSAGRQAPPPPEPEPETEPEPLYTDTVENVTHARTIIDGTADLPEWTPPEAESMDEAQPSRPDPDPWAAPSESAFTDTPEPEPEIMPEPDVMSELPVATDSSSDDASSETAQQAEQDAEPSRPEPPARQAKRFNPWN